MSEDTGLSSHEASRDGAFSRLWGWRGITTGAWTPMARMVAVLTLGLMCVTMVATQCNYVVVGDSHMMVVLAPITACALLYGPRASTIMGAITGLVEMGHAMAMPLDYYEKYFAAPWNSVLLFALIGFSMGLTFAFIVREQEAGSLRISRMAGLVLVCAFNSFYFTTLFNLSTAAINSMFPGMVPEELEQQLHGVKEVLSQMLANLGVMVIAVVLSERLAKLLHVRKEARTIRSTFQTWLAVVVLCAFMVCSSVLYTGITLVCRGNAERTMQTQLTNLSQQLSSRDSMISGIARRTSLSMRAVEELHQTTIASIAADATKSEGELCVVAEDGTIVSSSRDGIVGTSFEDLVGSGLQNGFDEAMFDEAVAREWNMGAGVLGYARVTQLAYVRVSQTGAYQLLVALPASEVFRYRPHIMAVTAALFVIIFFSVYVQASILLQNVVMRGFDETNDVLERITKGDLNQVVDVHDSVEFAHLSGGINATVGALKDSIAEAEARIARELSTAKAIQESALPSTFPPFPDIDKFDIYASMNAAKEVGGDFYDFFLVDEHTLGFLIADVSGKGIPASLFMMAAKTEIGNYMTSGMDLAVAIETANYHLCQGNDAGMFVTVWAATLDYTTGELTYVNAGHNPPLLRRNGTWEWLRERGGLFMGTFDMAKYRSKTIRLEKGDEVLLYTDGVTEAFDVSEEQYGEERLEAFLGNHRQDHPHALVDALRKELSAWSCGAEQSDDITMLSVEYGVAPEVTGSATMPAVLDSLDQAMGLIHAELGRRLCPIGVQNQIDIALEELFVNVCRYAYADQDTPGQVRVDYVYNTNPNAITIQLTDQGVPFNPLTREDPTRPSSIQEAKIGGLGIFMTKKSVDDLSYLYDGESNIVVFKKSW